jgi:hypothetical protein
MLLCQIVCPNLIQNALVIKHNSVFHKHQVEQIKDVFIGDSKMAFLPLVKGS